MGERDLARPRRGAAADQPGRRDRVVGRPERRGASDPPAGRAARDAGDPRDLDRLARGRAAAGSRAAAAPPSTCRRPAGRPSSMLWPPAAATSSARRSTGWPRRSARSGSRAGAVRRRRSRRRGRHLATAERAPRARPSDAIGAAPRSPPTSAASARVGGRRRRSPRPPRPRAASAIASAPRTGRTPPSSASSPASASAVEQPRRAAARRRRGSRRRSRGRSPGPALRRSAGARLTVIRCSGNSKPELTIAARTRSRDSRTAASGRPTIVKEGSPRRMSTSTSTGTASTPSRAKVRAVASTGADARRGRLTRWRRAIVPESGRVAPQRREPAHCRRGHRRVGSPPRAASAALEPMTEPGEHRRDGEELAAAHLTARAADRRAQRPHRATASSTSSRATAPTLVFVEVKARGVAGARRARATRSSRRPAQADRRLRRLARAWLAERPRAGGLPAASASTWSASPLDRAGSSPRSSTSQAAF